jgi:type II secretory pathway pseudopilin PulG
MAVMAVIAILLSVAAIGIQSIEKGQATTTAVAVTEALVEEARSTAIGRGARARLVIHADLNDADPEDRARYLSFMCVAAEETDAAGEPTGQWEVVSRGTQLPGGVFFSPEESRNADRFVTGFMDSDAKLGEVGEMTIELPGEKTVKRCVYIEFNSEGVCVDSDANGDAVGAAVVLVAGARPRDAAEPIVRGANKTGFVIWRNGRTTLFRDSNQLER